MDDAIKEIARVTEIAADSGIPFSVKAFVYYGEAPDCVQVLRHEYDGGGGDWRTMIASAITENIPSREDKPIMVRWMIEFQSVTGNHRTVGDRAE